MKGKIIFSSLFSIILLHGFFCFSQNKNNNTVADYDFAPREKVIFEDNFSQDTIGKFPSKWRLAKCNVPENYLLKKDCKVEKDGDEYMFNIAAKTTKGCLFIEPEIDTNSYLTDSFTLEVDFLLDSNTSSFGLNFPQSDKTTAENYHGFGCAFDGHPNKLGLTFDTPAGITATREYAEDCKVKEWHHFALSCYKRAIKCYIDGHYVFGIRDYGYSPYRFVITYGESLSWLGSTKYKNFRLATGREATPFSEILTEKKFVTHSITFDVNKSTIKQESTAFLLQFAKFLKMNAIIKLEIDGYTDSDGDAKNNFMLSETRANEVRKQLILLGIDGNRLTTKGFGATKPIAPNTTEIGKANNRRVEFVKL